MRDLRPSVRSTSPHTCVRCISALDDPGAVAGEPAPRSRPFCGSQPRAGVRRRSRARREAARERAATVPGLVRSCARSQGKELGLPCEALDSRRARSRVLRRENDTPRPIRPRGFPSPRTRRHRRHPERGSGGACRERVSSVARPRGAPPRARGRDEALARPRHRAAEMETAQYLLRRGRSARSGGYTSGRGRTCRSFREVVDASHPDHLNSSEGPFRLRVTNPARPDRAISPTGHQHPPDHYGAFPDVPSKEAWRGQAGFIDYRRQVSGRSGDPPPFLVSPQRRTANIPFLAHLRRTHFNDLAVVPRHFRT